MNINKLLEGVRCTCGRHHTCAIDKVYIEDGALSRFGDLCRDYGNILIVADENTYKAAGEKTAATVSGKIKDKVIFPGSEALIPDERAIAAVNERLSDVDLIIGIGSGVIQDLCKYVSHFSGIPYMISATAPSMDGYASTGAAMILKGMKETVPAGVPKAIVADTEVLKNAPFEMIKAGYGDIVGKYSALNDWELSRAVNGEYFCEYIYDLTLKTVEETLSLAEGIRSGDAESIGTLTEALITVGILMSFAGSSRPASGSEHHLSHFFEITGIVNGEKYLPHGIDVAYSTVITAKIREKIVSSEFPSVLYREDEKALHASLDEIYGVVAPECFALQERVGNYRAERLSVYLEKENEIKEIFKKMPSSDEILSMLGRVGLDMAEFYAINSDKKISDAVKYAKDLKDRYTCLWINYDLFGGVLNA